MASILSFLKACLDLIKYFLKKHLIEHIGYIFHVSDNVASMNREADILGGKLKGVEETIKEGELSRKAPPEEVERWRKRVEARMSEAESVQAAYGARGCMLFSISFNFVSNYFVSRRAAKELKKLEAEVKYITDCKEITTEVLPPNAQRRPVAPLNATSGSELQSKLKEAVDFLKKEDSPGTLGVWGMGGVGKTTLLKHINNALAKEDPSLRVVFATASRECTVDRLQGLIAKELNLREGWNHSDIFNYLEPRNFVILLDDLWDRIDLEAVGIPLPFGVVVDGSKEVRRKLIVVSRSENVCGKMNVRETLRVECLGREAARLLFREQVGGIEVIESHPLIPKLADDVADECGGLPQALIVIGRAMAGVRDYRVWEKAITDLRNSKTHEITGTDPDDPLPLLKISYDYLKDQQKQECLLHCALWPEDSKILKEDLIKCWMGHGLLEDYNNMEETHNKGHAIIDSLQKACLLEHVEASHDELINEHVKLHDLIRDMALWIARDCGRNEKKWVVLAGTQLQVQDALRDERTWGQAHKISLMENDIRELPSNIQSNPNLTTLILRENKNFSSFGRTVVRLFNALTYLDLSRCSRLSHFPIGICGLDALEYLNLSYTSIASLPQELKNLRKLKYLLLRGLTISDLPDRLFSDMVSLSELDLYMTRLPQRDDVPLMLGLDCLRGRLKVLGIEVTDPSNFQKLVRLSDMPIAYLSMALLVFRCFTLQLLSPDFLGKIHMRSHLKELKILYDYAEGIEIDREHCLASLETLHLSVPSVAKEIIWNGVDPVNVFPKLRKLYLSYCTLEHVTWAVSLPCLEELELRACDDMEYLVISSKMTELDRSRPPFPSLRILRLYQLARLTSICDQEITFPSLEYLDVIAASEREMHFPFTSSDSCRKLKAISGFSPNNFELIEDADMKEYFLALRTYQQP